MAASSRQKSGQKSGAPGTFKPGADPRRGRGPDKGAPNAGRPPNEFKDYCAALLADPKAESQVESILRDRRHPAFAVMWKAVADRAYGKPRQSVEHTGADGGPIKASVTVRFVAPDAPEPDA